MTFVIGWTGIDHRLSLWCKLAMLMVSWISALLITSKNKLPKRLDTVIHQKQIEENQGDVNPSLHDELFLKCTDAGMTASVSINNALVMVKPYTACSHALFACHLTPNHRSSSSTSL